MLSHLLLRVRHRSTKSDLTLKCRDNRVRRYFLSHTTHGKWKRSKSMRKFYRRYNRHTISSRCTCVIRKQIYTYPQLAFRPGRKQTNSRIQVTIKSIKCEWTYSDALMEATECTSFALLLVHHAVPVAGYAYVLLAVLDGSFEETYAQVSLSPCTLRYTMFDMRLNWCTRCDCVVRTV